MIFELKKTVNIFSGIIAIITVIVLPIKAITRNAIVTDSSTIIRRNLTTADGMAHDCIVGFCQDKNGVIWICNWYALERYDGYTFHSFRPQRDLCSNSRIRAASMVNDSIIVIKTVNGKLLSFSLTDYTFHNYNASLPVNVKHFRKDYIDSIGNRWETGRGNRGVVIFTQKPSNYHFIRNNEYPIARAIYEDRQHRIWISWCEDENKTTAKGEVVIYNTNGEKIKTVINNVAVYSICEDSKHCIWLGTRRNGMIVLKPDNNDGYSRYDYRKGVKDVEMVGDWVFDIYEDSCGRIWIATLDGGIGIVDNSYNVWNLKVNRLPHYPYGEFSRARCILECNGYILIGTDYGLLRTAVDNTSVDMRFQVFRADGKEGNLPADEVINIVATHKDRILLSTFGSGIYEFSNLDGSFTPLVADNVADKQAVFSVIDNGKGKLWVAAQTDLFLYGHGSQPLTPILEPLRMIETCPLRDSRNQCWFATSEGVLCISQQFNDTEERIVPKIFFSEIICHKTDTTCLHLLSEADSVLTINPDERNLSVKVSSLCYGSNKGIKYLWRIAESTDTTWNEIVDNNELRLPLLSPGVWTLEVKSTDNSGMKLNNIGKLKFTRWRN